MEILKTIQDCSNEERSQLFRNKKREILKAKKATPKTSDSINIVGFPHGVGMPSVKALPEGIELLNDEFFIVGNSIGFMDSHKDVSMRGSWDETVKQIGDRVPIFKDHNYGVDNIFAINKGSIITDLPIKGLGYDREGNTQVLGAKIQVLDKGMLEKYSDGRIKEHSVGLRYVRLDLAVNDEDDEEGYKIWQMEIDKVINRELAESIGYFYPIYEQKLIEISAVGFGSNPYTPAMKDNKPVAQQEPSKGTRQKDTAQSGNEFLKHLIY